MLNSLLLMAMLVVNGATPAPDHDLQYDLPVGMAYTYRITTDHFPVPGRGMRLHTKLVLEVLSKDAGDYTHCTMKLLADSIYDRDQAVTYIGLGDISFTGHKLYASGGYANAVFDSRGRMETEEEQREKEERTDKQVQTQLGNLQYVQAAVSGNSPFMMQLLIPSLPKADRIDMNKEYYDTITVPSRAQHVPTSYGVSGKVSREILYDTVHRVFTLDSIVASDTKHIGYITLKTHRYELIGTQYRTEAKLVRDMNTGLVNSFDEICYKISPRKENLWYISKARLVDTSPIKRAEPDRVGAGTYPR